MLKLFLRLAVFSFALFFSAAVFAENSLMVHADMGTYNQGYNDLSVKDNNETTFGMGQSCFGMEYIHINSERISKGGGFVMTNMESGRTWNFNRYEVHRSTMVLVPYFFTGYGFRLIGIEMGISSYLQFSRHDPVLYYAPDGSSRELESGSMRFDRGRSHSFVNARVRLFEEKSLHCKIKVGRENFDPVDSLINFNLVYPFDNHQLEFYLSFLTIDNYLYKFFDQDNVLKSNQTTGILYSYSFGVLSIGARGGVLIYNAHGGHGSTPVQNRLSGGIFSIMKW